MIVVIDYGAGNIFSVINALKYLGVENKVSSNKNEIVSADKLILPGVGAFGDAMKNLDSCGLTEVVKSAAMEKPFLGICLGMQMLFEQGFEFGEHKGLGLIKGSVELMKPQELAIPQMGWNELLKNNDCPILDGIEEESYVYFVHSYAVVCNSENVAAYCDYGGKVPAVVFEKNIYGCQFHPEKSGKIGLKILENFCRI